jgi:hypothetical protein
MDWYFQTGKDPTFDRLCRASGNPGLTPADRMRFFAPYAFYNFVSVSLGVKYRRAVKEDFLNPDNRRLLIEVLRSLKVQAVWILGTTQAGYSESIVDEVIGEGRCVTNYHPTSDQVEDDQSIIAKGYQDFSRLLARYPNSQWVGSVNGIDIYQVQRSGTTAYRIDQKRFKFALWSTLDGCRAYAKQLAVQKRRIK